MKKIISFLSILALLFGSTTSVYAVEGLGNSNATKISSRAAERTEKISEKMQMMEDKKSDKLNDRADREIQRRINALNKLIGRINSIHRITAAQKSSLISEIQAEISSLQTLDTKIKSDTDVNNLKSDVESIVKSYRVFLLFMPKIEVIAASDRLSDVADKMSSFSAKLKSRIDTAKSQGKDVSSLEALLTDMNSKVADAKTQSSNAINAVLPLTPDGYPSNASILLSARKMIQTGRQDLVAALQDGQKIRHGLMTSEKGDESSESAKLTPTVSLSVTPTEEPQPTQ